MAMFFALLIGIMSGGFFSPVAGAPIVAPMDTVGGMSGG